MHQTWPEKLERRASEQKAGLRALLGLDLGKSWLMLRYNVHQNISTLKRRTSLSQALHTLAFPVHTTAAWAAGTVAIVAMPSPWRRRGVLGRWSQKGKHSETGAFWLH